jgi:hypothetical protein
VKTKRQHTNCSECPETCFCGSAEKIEQNHLGGNNHVPWLWYPFCKKDHGLFHILCRRAGIDFSKTSNKSRRLVQALKAMLVGLWMVMDMLEEQLSIQSEDQS